MKIIYESHIHVLLMFSLEVLKEEEPPRRKKKFYILIWELIIYISNIYLAKSLYTGLEHMFRPVGNFAEKSSIFHYSTERYSKSKRFLGKLYSTGASST